ncbi:MAG: DinB family protein [Acidobacteriia bacterium]|nr:DinB family protein [Terriglobia bacterium]
MRRMKWLFASIVVLAACGIAAAQASKPAEVRTLATVADGAISGVEGEFVPAAEAMPEDKYSFAPTSGEFKGVRTFGQQVKHVSAVNYLVASAILGEKPPVDLGSENGPDSVKTKADTMKFLKDSFAYAHKAAASITAQNAVEPIKSPFGQGTTTRLGLATLITGHCFDHYGQMVEYLRMNSIIPPASR